jgi:hypothetical protein
MTSWIVWAVALAVVALHAYAGYHFSVRTLRVVTLIIVAALVVTITAYGERPPGARPPDNLGSAFALGSDRLSGAFFHHALAPGPLGWVLIGVVLLVGYRQCEAWALRRQAPALDTSGLGGGQPSIGADATPGGPMTDAQRHDWLAAELKFRLAAVEVHSPPILPGGSRSDALASIAAASGVTEAGLAAAIIRFLSTLWPSPRRYELRVWMECPSLAGARAARAASATGTTRVTVELSDPRAGDAVATKTVVTASMEDAASMTAGYVARQIFSRDPATPPWCYGAADGRDLGALVLARQERVYVESMDDVHRSRRDQIAVLRKVAGSGRCAGVVRYELAQLEDLDCNYLAALRLHALNREQYPRFLRGVYRLCMSLEMIAVPEYTFSDLTEVRAVLDETLDILCRHGLTAIGRCQAGDADYQSGLPGRFVLPRELRGTLLGAARSELRVIRRQLSFPIVVWNTLTRRDERAVWRPHWHRATRQGFLDGVRVAELLVAVKQRLNEREAADGPHVDGQPGGNGGGRPRFGERARARIAGAAERFGQRAGIRIATAIAGDAEPIRRVLYADQPSADWPGPPKPATASGGTLRMARDRVRWLPWQARTASWQAAYNTACLYAVLAQHGLADQEKVVISLRRLVGNRDSGLERPYDWISNDPDFTPLLGENPADGKVSDFLAAQKRRDYPDAPSVPLQRARSMTTRPGQEAIRLTGCIAAVFRLDN